jgi:hypothetical protein
MSPSQKVRSYLEVISNVAVLLVAIAVLVSAVNYFRAGASLTQLQGGLQKETTLSPLTGVNYADTAHTLLIAMNTRCQNCTDSVSFYNQLAELQRNNLQAIRVIAIFPNSPHEVSEYVQQQRLLVSNVAGVDFDRLNLAGSPTLILVDRQGKILDFWVGKLSTSNEQALIQRISREG